jgi:(p)ppGpp synthase/HD superfamily hydrolase
MIDVILVLQSSVCLKGVLNMPTSEKTAVERIAAALALAKEIHAGQSDKGGNAYIYHVLDVAARVSHLGPDHEIVALLHMPLKTHQIIAR